jgi:tetratricopeptide (TPR) repeat protein
MAIMQRILGRVQDAKTTVREGLERHPDFPGLHAVKASMLRVEGRLGEALKWARSAVELNPSNIINVRVKCFMYLEIGDDSSAERCYEGLDESFPESGSVNIAWLYIYRSQINEARNILEQRAQPLPNDQTLHYWAWHYTIIGDSSKARSILEEVDPHLFGDADVVINPVELYWTVLAAHVLYVDDEKDRANYLFDQALDAMQSMNRSGPIGFNILDAFIHVARGERQRAILALRDAVHGGWRRSWFLLRSPHFASIRDEPEWIELVNELESDIAKQRQWYEDHKDDPVF